MPLYNLPVHVLFESESLNEQSGKQDRRFKRLTSRAKFKRVTEETEDLEEDSITTQYKKTYPDLYKKHREAVASRNPMSKEKTRANLAFKMMTQQQVSPSKVSNIVKTHKKRATQTKGIPFVIKRSNQN